eukprot:746391-Hanusia_phi.AAC.2
MSFVLRGRGKDPYALPPRIVRRPPGRGIGEGGWLRSGSGKAAGRVGGHLPFLLRTFDECARGRRGWVGVRVGTVVGGSVWTSTHPFHCQFGGLLGVRVVLRVYM